MPLTGRPRSHLTLLPMHAMHVGRGPAAGTYPGPGMATGRPYRSYTKPCPAPAPSFCEKAAEEKGEAEGAWDEEAAAVGVAATGMDCWGSGGAKVPSRGGGPCCSGGGGWCWSMPSPPRGGGHSVPACKCKWDK